MADNRRPMRHPAIPRRPWRPPRPRPAAGGAGFYGRRYTPRALAELLAAAAADPLDPAAEIALARLGILGFKSRLEQEPEPAEELKLFQLMIDNAAKVVEMQLKRSKLLAEKEGGLAGLLDAAAGEAANELGLPELDEGDG
jgi:hypothetical protein